MQRRAMLIILDGWGLATAGPTNAVSVAKTPIFDHLWSVYPHMKLAASGAAVGLPVGQMGNSEVGHTNIGAGRVVLQDLPMINEEISSGRFFQNKALLTAIASAKKQKRPLHLIGLVSSGGVHSHEKHLYALLEMAKQNGLHEVFVHVITDGRDVDPKTARESIAKLEAEMKRVGVGKVATVCGRYYAMDRDHRWDRTKKAYDAIVEGKGVLATSPTHAVQESYDLGIFDEFIRPIVVDRGGSINDGDAVIFFNFRSDRPRQLVRSLVSNSFSSFKRGSVVSGIRMTTLTEYEKDLPVAEVAFPFRPIANTFSKVLSVHGLTQFHIAETEKYAHVTYFFDGGNEYKEKGEDRFMVPSPKVATYDEKPEMSAYLVRDELIQRIGEYDFMIVNFANPDMVGHTGIMEAAVEAVEDTDSALGDVVQKAYDEGYEIVIVADHGNAEKMAEADGSPCTSHTTNPVPFILVSDHPYRLDHKLEAKLANIAPTLLSVMGIPKPKEMTEPSLVKR